MNAARKTQIVSARLPIENVRSLEAQADAIGMPRSTYLRKFLIRQFPAAIDASKIRTGVAEDDADMWGADA